MKIAAVLSEFCNGDREVGAPGLTATVRALEGPAPAALVTPAAVMAELLRAKYEDLDVSEIDARTDYGPSKTTAELGARIGIPDAAWPYKALFAAEVTGGTCHLKVKSGYRGDFIHMQFALAARGWVCGPERIPAALADVVADAIILGHAPRSWTFASCTAAEYEALATHTAAAAGRA